VFYAWASRKAKLDFRGSRYAAREKRSGVLRGVVSLEAGILSPNGHHLGMESMLWPGGR
jgi:hypothetical protein